MKKLRVLIFKKIKFYDFNRKDFNKIIKKKGLFLFPSGPGLSTLESQPAYSKALINADYVFFDSGYFILLLKILKKIVVNKFSGFIFLQMFLNYLKNNKNTKILSIDPNINSSKLNINLFKRIGLNKKNIINYIAPTYNSKNINDKKLLKVIKEKKPEYILINIAGGKQEILGLYIRNKYKYKCTILCTGAAIAYFTGNQAPINFFFDKFYLGWLVRIVFNPSIFLIRYIKTFKLFFIVFKNNVIIKHI
tara:strand:- start:1922 stop:2668 length:747 start_codon:yes stop_codon:yes gene_type:complete